MVKLLVGLSLLLLIACSSAEKVDKKIQKGLHQHIIECRGWINQCYFKAQDRCVNGYKVLDKVTRNKTGGSWGTYKSYKIRIHCK